MKLSRKLPLKVEFSGILPPGGSNEKLKIYGNPDYWDSQRTDDQHVIPLPIRRRIFGSIFAIPPEH